LGITLWVQPHTYAKKVVGNPSLNTAQRCVKGTDERAGVDKTSMGTGDGASFELP